VQGLIAAGADGDWSLGGSILTMAFPMILFIVVASALYVLYTKPHLVPGHRYQMVGRTAVQTAPVTPPGQAGRHAAPGGQATASGAEGTGAEGTGPEGTGTESTAADAAGQDS
jgi:hypothetical protein